MTASRIERISLVVSDLPRAIEFYRAALGFTPEEAGIREGEAFARLLGIRGARAAFATLALGAERIELLAFLAQDGVPPGRPYPAGSASNDLWFQHFAIIVDDIEAGFRRVEATGGHTPISEGGPVQLPESSGGAVAWKFRDPDGHPLELLMFPPGKAPEKWASRQADAAAQPFLGIDHSAIAVADTGVSEAFWRDLMGLPVASRSLNVGAEQEKLDAVFNARVEVTGLALPAASAPHVELLCYRVPPTGRPIAVDTRSNDVAATSLVIEAVDLASLVDAAMRRRTAFVSAGIVDLPGGARAASLRDPDGHLLVLTEPAGQGPGQS